MAVVMAVFGLAYYRFVAPRELKDAP
jgi:hypothetical protein